MQNKLSKVKYDAEMNVIDNKTDRSKPKVKSYDDTYLINYWLERDRVLWDQNKSREDILTRYPDGFK